MRILISSLHPEALVFLPTSLNITTTSWLDGLDCRSVGFASCPFYNASELITVARCIGWTRVKQYLRHLLMPEFLWAAAMRWHMHAVIAQSETTAAWLVAVLGSTRSCSNIPPGIDLSLWPYQSERCASTSEPLRLLYLGSAVAIRGFDIALDALAPIRNLRLMLRVLARDADADMMASIQHAVARRGMDERVEIEGGWIDRVRLIEEIHFADAVLQPFVLVPSALPAAALEVIACGTPVIGTSFDGLPSTIGPAGIVVSQVSAAALAEAIRLFAQDANVRVLWHDGCRQQRATMLDWDVVTDRWEAVLLG
jgi:glycosyltransferase involved in cell wall biosynthesis